MLVALHTLGCKLNFSETSTMARLFLEAGYTRTDFNSVADVYVINTCSVTEEANHKCRQMIRRCIRLNPRAKVVVTGCYAQLKPDEVAAIDGVSLVLGSNKKNGIVGYLDQLEDNKIVSSDILHDKEFCPSYSSGDRTRSFLKIQDGCDYYCTYCTIPFARGASRYASLADTLKVANEAAQHGAKEIILTGVNIGDFGRKNKETFLDLIRALEDVDGVERYRISSIEPNLLTDEVIRHVASSGKFMPHFHVPLQSGSDAVLRLMHRRYNTALFRSKMEAIRAAIPDAFIGIDVIVGTNGETPELFNETRQFLESIPFSQLHVFTYSEREGTLALKIKPVVALAERHARNAALQELSNARLREFYLSQQNLTRTVLWESAEKDNLMHGFTNNYVRVVRPFDAALVNTITPTTLGQLIEGKDLALSAL